MKQAVFIMVDTQRTDMLSCYDLHAPKTPNLDKLARGGVRYNKGYTCQPVCGPARSAIFTGLYPHSNGMETNSMPLRSKIKTIGDYMQESSIACGYVGKWHLDGGDYFGYGVAPKGFNDKYWYDGRNFLDDLGDEGARRLSRKHMGARLDDPKEEDTHAHRCVDRAINFVEEFKEKDFFLTLSLDEPHDPCICPRRFLKELKRERFKLQKTPNIRASLKDKPEHQQVWAKRFRSVSFFALKVGMAPMMACNKFADYEIGRLLDKIESIGIEPLILYTSDHGDMMMSHRILGKGCVMYNEITNVPFIIKGGGFGVGVSDTPVSHIDILPTILTHLGVKAPQMLCGQPLQNIENSNKRDVFMEFTRYEVDHDGFMGFQPIRCIFDGRYKLVINLMTDDELYDLDKDKYEKCNLIYNEATAKVRNELHDRLIDKMNVTRDMYRGYYWHCRKWRKDVTPSFDHTGYTRQLVEEDFVQCDYSTGMPMISGSRKK